MRLVTPPDPRGRVGFVVPRWAHGGPPGAQGIPFRSFAVAGALYHAGFELVFFDQELDGGHRDRVDRFLDGIRGVRSVIFWMNDLSPTVQLDGVQRLATVVKERDPATPILVGGPFISLCPPGVLRPEWPIDFFLRGYGEEGCVAFVDASEAVRSLERVPGLVWREDGAIRANPPAAPARFRPEYFSLYRRLDLTPYRQKGGIFGNADDTFMIGSGQGCAKRCRFCYWHGNRPVLAPPELVVDLVEWIRHRYQVCQFHLAELDFFTSRRRVLTLAREWKRRLPDCRWFALASPQDAERLSGEDWDLLAAGGCVKLEFGTESGSKRVLQSLGKGHDPEAPLRITERALAHGIHTMHNFIFGIPGETESDRRASLRLVRELLRLDRKRVFFAFRLFQPCWGTQLGETAIAAVHGFPGSLAEVPTYRARFADPLSHTLEWLEAEDDRRVKRMVFYYLPMLTSRFALGRSAERLTYSTLRAVAGVRLRLGAFRLGVDRWLFHQVIRGRLDNTYVP